MVAATDELLQREFGKRLGDEGICVIDPCTGTGNFVVNLLGHVARNNRRELESFYRERLFANEVMLMPYYIASLNIEHEFYRLSGRYEAFECRSVRRFLAASGANSSLNLPNDRCDH